MATCSSKSRKPQNPVRSDWYWTAVVAGNQFAILLAEEINTGRSRNHGKCDLPWVLLRVREWVLLSGLCFFRECDENGSVFSIFFVTVLMKLEPGTKRIWAPPVNEPWNPPFVNSLSSSRPYGLTLTIINRRVFVGTARSESHFSECFLASSSPSPRSKGAAKDKVSLTLRNR